MKTDYEAMVCAVLMALVIGFTLGALWADRQWAKEWRALKPHIYLK